MALVQKKGLGRGKQAVLVPPPFLKVKDAAKRSTSFGKRSLPYQTLDYRDAIHSSPLTCLSSKSTDSPALWLLSHPDARAIPSLVTEFSRGKARIPLTQISDGRIEPRIARCCRFDTLFQMGLSALTDRGFAHTQLQPAIQAKLSQ